MVESISRQMFANVSDCFGPSTNSHMKIITKRMENRQINHQHLSSEGSFIIQNMPVRHPIGLIISKLVRQVFVGCGDGTISTLCILSNLLKACGEMVVNFSIHPNLICETLRKLEKLCIDEMKRHSKNILVDENGRPIDLSSTKNSREILELKLKLDETLCREMIQTFLRTKMDEKESQIFTPICIKASFNLYENLTVQELKNLQLNPNFHHIDVLTMTSLSCQAEYFQGVAFEHGVQDPYMPREFKNCRVLLLSSVPLELIKEKKKNEFHTAEERLMIVRGERQFIEKQIDYIIQSSATVVISNDAIDDISLNKFSKNKILALRHVRQDVFDKIADLTGSTKMYCCDSPINDEYLGFSEQITVQEDYRQLETIVRVQGQNNRIGTIIVSASNKTNQQRYQRVIKGALKVLRNTFEDCLILPGGGFIDMTLSNFIQSQNMNSLSIAEQTVYQAFSNILEQSIPATLCERCGFNVNTTLKKWRSALTTSDSPIAINCTKYPVEFINPIKEGIWDSLRVKIQSFHQTIETVTTLLNIDSILTSPDLKQYSQQRFERILSELEANMHEDDTDEWKYKRFHSPLSSNTKISEKRKKELIKKEGKFYSKEASKQRKKMEKRDQPVEPFGGFLSQEVQLVKREQERKLRERGLLGYSLDPFEK